MKKIKWSLKYKITLFVSFLIFLLFFLTNTIIIRHEKGILYNNLIQKGDSLINNFILQSENSFFTRDELGIEDYVSVLKKDEEIRSIYILLTNGTYFLSDKEELLGKKYSSPKLIHSDTSKNFNIVMEDNEIFYQFFKPMYKYNREGAKISIGSGYIELTTQKIKIKLNQIKIQLIVIFMFLLSAGIAGAFLLSRFMTNPIKTLINGINTIAKGNLKFKINIKTKDEIENLADEFNKMTTQLANYQKKLIKQKIVEQELQIARNIQSRIIPDKMISLEKKYEMFNFYRSSRTIGGDYHNVISVNNSEYLFIIADVSGKGIPASLLMVMFHTVLITLKDLHSRPLMLMKAINSILCGFLKHGDFITAVLGLLDKQTGCIKVVSAGHESPLIVNLKKRSIDFLKSSSLPIGLLSKEEFESKLDILEYKLLEENLLLFYTDGIRNIRKKPFNNTELNNFFNSLIAASNNYTEFKNLLLDKIKLRKYDDDLTVMGLIKTDKI